MWVCRSVVALLLPAYVAGCAYHLDDPIDAHYQRYKARMPEGDRVFACHAYGCKIQTPFRFTDADIAKLQSLMSAAKTKTAADERAAIRETLAWMEHRVDAEVGTANDRPGDDFGGSGDPSQMDCVDVATNLSSYMLVLDGHQLLRHHSVGGVYVKEDYRKGIVRLDALRRHSHRERVEPEVRRRRMAAGKRQAAGDHRSREVVHRRQRHPLRRQGQGRLGRRAAEEIDSRRAATRAALAPPAAFSYCRRNSRHPCDPGRPCSSHSSMR